MRKTTKYSRRLRFGIKSPHQARPHASATGLSCVAESSPHTRKAHASRSDGRTHPGIIPVCAGSNARKNQWERRVVATRAAPGVNVSTHAPARGATDGGSLLGRLHNVSIHTSARSATYWCSWSWCPSGSFNPRAREGRDCRSSSLQSQGRGVNPRTCGEARLYPKVSAAFVALFQFTRPRGARHVGGPGPGTYWVFQSTRPRGRDETEVSSAGAHLPVSIHAHARDATGKSALCEQIANVSILAHARDATRVECGVDRRD